tara:strand:- start:12051 stop:12587 length:537 start_codon:yes stop_codon:yes gene_type:complete
MSKEGICASCNKVKKDLRYSESQNRIICNWCYRKHIWKPKQFICPRCGKNKPHHGKGLCNGCYSSVHQIHNVRRWNAVLHHKIDPDLYKKITRKCEICGFDKIVEMHHIDHNHSNNSSDNLVGLCPNHHKMIHRLDYQEEIYQTLEEKRFKVPKRYQKTSEHYKKNLKAPTKQPKSPS